MINFVFIRLGFLLSLLPRNYTINMHSISLVYSIFILSLFLPVPSPLKKSSRFYDLLLYSFQKLVNSISLLSFNLSFPYASTSLYLHFLLFISSISLVPDAFSYSFPCIFFPFPSLSYPRRTLHSSHIKDT